MHFTEKQQGDPIHRFVPRVDDRDSLQEEAVKLFTKCLTSNHVGTFKDEELEEHGSLMVNISFKVRHSE